MLHGSRNRNGSRHGSMHVQWVATIQAAGGLVRTNIPMKNTILRIALTNKKQMRVQFRWLAQRPTFAWAAVRHAFQLQIA